MGEKTVLFWEYRIVAIAPDCKSGVSDIGCSSPSTPTKTMTSLTLSLGLMWGSLSNGEVLKLFDG